VLVLGSGDRDGVVMRSRGAEEQWLAVSSGAIGLIEG